MTVRNYSVPDVSCEHCVAAITREVSKVEGVHEVKVDLDAKTVTIEADDSTPESDLKAAIDEAGFDIAA